ncbi:hypothetical protein METBIDRAFT_30736 [Metschnikowia bicuspidata var. bicuspidata NRRL YB-4993]|uniref:Cullin family profile domain-containing protein n=1 Tax=Metschnikowia bicuspidata var. bicuspidata NRRL YB-4993 TaxID=869754 RepID=A0A1A0HKQ4_9ASCO|nr:hypothetical protein METBIDRAFT_30736 [Metschnikowia bicuspidata var. bicuspidata NRRL YB-4993]OBA24472.1 hypothetical protein METBIDRAFT_30736 [Metschnikowia bicuspidata var. bicuspidata NRRL YB-4993]
MKKLAILDMGGDTSASSVSGSHLGSGSPNITPDAYHPKRAKHYSEDFKHRITQLKAQLHEIISKILNGDQVNDLYALIYRDVEHLCIAKHSEQALLSEFIFHEIDKALSTGILPRLSGCLQNSADNSMVDTAKSFLKIYSDWDRSLMLLLQLFLFLDRSYLLHHPRHLCIREYGIRKFVDRLMIHSSSEDVYQKSNDPVCTLVSLLLAETRKDRSNYSLFELTTNLITTLGQMDPDNNLNVNTSLESIMIKDYTKLLKLWMKNKTNYVLELLRNMNDDGILLMRASKSPVLVNRINSKLKWKFLLSELSLFLEPSLPALTQPQNLHYLEAVRCFCDNSMTDYGVDSTKVLLVLWGKYVQSRSKSIGLESDVIPSILDLWDDLMRICKKGFKSDSFEFEVRTALTKSFGKMDLATTIALHLSKYCDSAMKQASKAEETFSELKANVITIFKLIPDKLAFLFVYEKDLSKRILMARNFSFTFEKQLVDAIVSVVGENDENFKMRAMLRDYSNSKSLFSHLHFPSAPQMDFSALVLEKKVWPEIPGFETDICLPHALKLTLTEFERTHLKNDENHKVLDWRNYTLHQITLTTSFASETKELQVNLLQAIILMLFQEVNTVSFTYILHSTRMDEKILRRVLASLTTDKYPILKIHGDVITFNDDFKDKSGKIKLPMGREKESVVIEGTKKLLHQGRSSETRSALVRIMKMHKSLPFTQLLGKVIEVLTPRGTTNIQEIKAEIEYLILTDYIARDAMGSTLSYIP